MCICYLLNSSSKGEWADLVKVMLSEHLCEGQWHFHITERASFNIIGAKGVNNYCKKRHFFQANRNNETLPLQVVLIDFSPTLDRTHHSLTPGGNLVSVSLMCMFLDCGRKLEGSCWQRPRRCGCTSCAVVCSGVFFYHPTAAFSYFL